MTRTAKRWGATLLAVILLSAASTAFCADGLQKVLDPEWVRGLHARGEKEVFSGKSLKTIGMPCGGIAAGQLYLCGDGTLGSWKIFNNPSSNWIEGTGSTYSSYGKRIPEKPVDQGFAVGIRTDGGQMVLKSLSAEGFTDVTFRGEYPIGRITYAEAGSPVEVEMEAFSPFIPLNALDSALPATVFNITVRNTSDATVEASALGWLENVVCYASRGGLTGQRQTAFRTDGDRVVMEHSAASPPVLEGNSGANAIVFQNFEAGYGNWTTEGEAFGEGSATGTFPGQQDVLGFTGKGLVNSFGAGDAPTGKLISPTFTIERPFINLLVGGGAHEKSPYTDEVAVHLIVGDQIVQSVRGNNTEMLEWKSWYVQDLRGQKARIEIVDASTIAWGHILVDQIEFDDLPRSGVEHALVRASDFGSMALGYVGPLAKGTQAFPTTASGDQPGLFVANTGATYDLSDQRLGLLQAKPVQIASGEAHTFSFVLSWHFPNSRNGRFYVTRFADAGEVVDYVLDHSERLTADTRLWRDTYYDSTLPYWLLDRLMSTTSYLATGTCQWWENDRFWAFEGCACCEGTCTHVWNYAHGHARLFPSIARNIREMQDFNPRQNDGGFNPDSGLVGFRGNDAYAADGQCGSILKAYREHLMAPDSSFLARHWPRIRKALEYSILQDGNNDGLIENTQHNTFDINYEGANTFIGSLYLAALRAGEEMAREMGDDVFAEHAHAIYEEGRRRSMERLWDGEYFIQEVDLEAHPRHQYGPGCLSDQIFGQGWADQVALGYIYPRHTVRSTLRSVWKYNWTTDVSAYNTEHKPGRWFISPNQAGLLTCTWPKSEYLPNGTVYKNEVWTGIEYQVAGHMAWEGMVDEALIMCRAIHDRYQPDLLNPYNEVECGDHYARALASWGVYTGLQGFEIHGPNRHIGFAPRITPDAYRAAFTSAEGWGTFSQERDGKSLSAKIDLKWGRLPLASLSLGLPEGHKATKARLKVNGKNIRATSVSENGQIVVRPKEQILIEAGETVEITARLSKVD